MLSIFSSLPLMLLIGAACPILPPTTRSTAAAAISLRAGAPRQRPWARRGLSTRLRGAGASWCFPSLVSLVALQCWSSFGLPVGEYTGAARFDLRPQLAVRAARVGGQWLQWFERHRGGVAGSVPCFDALSCSLQRFPCADRGAIAQAVEAPRHALQCHAVNPSGIVQPWACHSRAHLVT